MHKSFFLAALLFISSFSFCQSPKTYSSSQIFEQIKKLNVLGSVLYVAAHPDDENTRLLAFLANDRLYRTGYLSMTRGDGGQNLIGDEQGIELGLIRTQELLAARNIDGAEQFFTRAFDFGFTKNPEETFAFWDHDKILSDVVWVIRKFRPDVIITRFPTTGEGGHGHHTASAILAGEAFEAAADPHRFPEQLAYGVQPWQAKRLLWNTFNFGSTNTESPDQFTINAGGYNALLGRSYGEIAAESRSQHKTQGFGVPSSRGAQLEYFKTIKGSAPVTTLMDGINTSWDRLHEKSIGTAVQALIRNFSFLHPENSLPQLITLHRLIKNCKDAYWKTQKLTEVEEIIKECAGLYMEAATRTLYAVQGDPVQVNVTVNKRAGGNIHLSSVTVFGKKFDLNDNLPADENVTHTLQVSIPVTYSLSQPYWLAAPMSKGSYNVAAQADIGKAQNDPERALIHATVNGESMVFEVPVRYKSNDPVKGEEFQPVFVIPKAEVKPVPEIALSLNNTPVKIDADITRNDDQVSLSPVSAAGKNITEDNRDGRNYFSIKDPASGTADTILFSVTGDRKYDQYKRLITYPHIPDILYFHQAASRLVNIDLHIAGKKAGYIPGAGDKIPEALTKMGYEVSILSPKDITESNLRQFDVIVTGVRAYNIYEWLNNAYGTLMNYVKDGGVLLVQYNTNNNIGPVKAQIGPYPFTISRTRVTDENAEVSFLDPDNALLRYPNQITQKDFDGWIQERSTYEAVNFGKEYKTLFAMHDKDETTQHGSLIYANYGKGRFIYSGLVFFRQLPAGVPGAYRLFANLLARPQIQ